MAGHPDGEGDIFVAFVVVVSSPLQDQHQGEISIVLTDHSPNSQLAVTI